ncbi:MAG: putative cold shock protein A [Phycisphaerae bacterium]|nr:putative cold shock protein A [Phycisphaerae bacterium]
MSSGTVKWFDCKKGYGFLRCDGVEQDIFVHYSTIEGDGFRKLKFGERVDFELVTDPQKGFQAIHVRRVEQLAEQPA